MDQELQHLDFLEEKIDHLLQNGKFLESIESMEELTSIKMDIFGESSNEYQKSSEKLCELLNMSAMNYLQQQKFDLSLDLLKKAEKLSFLSQKYRASTFNNLACYYRKTGKIRTALNYLTNSLEIEQKLDMKYFYWAHILFISEKKNYLMQKNHYLHVQNQQADTHLNLCAVLSQLDRHDEALEHSLLSIILICLIIGNNELLSQALKQYRKGGGFMSNQMQSTNSTFSIDNNQQGFNQDRIAVLAIAYHNLGVEYEHLKRNDEALKIFQKSKNFAMENLGPSNQLTQNLSKVLNNIQLKNQSDKKNNHKYVKKPYNETTSSKEYIQTEVSYPLTNQPRPLPKINPQKKQQFILNQYVVILLFLIILNIQIEIIYMVTYDPQSAKKKKISNRTQFNSFSINQQKDNQNIFAKQNSLKRNQNNKYRLINQSFDTERMNTPRDGQKDNNQYTLDRSIEIFQESNRIQSHQKQSIDSDDRNRDDSIEFGLNSTNLNQFSVPQKPTIYNHTGKNDQKIKSPKMDKKVEFAE